MSGGIIPTILGKGVEIFRDWATARFLTSYGWPQKCHGACLCVI